MPPLGQGQQRGQGRPVILPSIRLCLWRMYLLLLLATLQKLPLPLLLQLLLPLLAHVFRPPPPQVHTLFQLHLLRIGICITLRSSSAQIL